jgi:hypothetical protein
MLALTNAAHCLVEAAGGGAWLVTKTGGSDGVADASAVSAAGIAGDFVLRARLIADGSCYVGVSPDPEADHGFAAMPHALNLLGLSARPTELGVTRPPIFTVAGYAWLRRAGGTIEYGTGPDLANLSVRRTVPAPQGPVRFDSSLLGAGMTVEVAIGGAAEFEPGRRGRRQAVAIGLGF